jgi:hypothetical protein
VPDYIYQGVLDLDGALSDRAAPFEAGTPASRTPGQDRKKYLDWETFVAEYWPVEPGFGLPGSAKKSSLQLTFFLQTENNSVGNPWIPDQFPPANAQKSP